MSVASESMEHAGHAAHGAHHGGPGKMIGLSMALYGVLLAICAAKVGGERTELTKAMVEQTQVSAESQANQMKYRLVMLELEKVRAKTTPGVELAPDSIEARTLDRLLVLVTQYIGWKESTKTLAKSYAPMIEAHSEATERYEHAQLAAEVGIVVASIALLLASRKVWYVALLFGATGIGLLGHTYIKSGHEIEEAEHSIEEAKEAYAHLRTTQDPNADDKQTIDVLDPGGVKRAQIAEAAEHKGAAAAKTAEAHGEHGHEHEHAH